MTAEFFNILSRIFFPDCDHIYGRRSAPEMQALRMNDLYKFEIEQNQMVYFKR